MNVCITKITLKPGTRDTFIEAALKCVEATLKEPGCIQHDYTLSTVDPNVVFCVERWENMDYAFAHMNSAHFKALSEVSNKCMATAPDVRLFDAEPSTALEQFFPTQD